MKTPPASTATGSRSCPVPPSPIAARSSNAFTLIEILVVIAILAVLISFMAPTLTGARVAARMVATHAALAQVDLALEVYVSDNKEQIPPTRSGCSFRTAYELPPELAVGDYLPSADDAGITRVTVRDSFTKAPLSFRAPGPVIMNEVTLLTGLSGGKIYVPDRFPTHLDEPGSYTLDRATSKVRYAIWSMGPDPLADKLRINPGRGPVLKRFWMMHANDQGVVTHIAGNNVSDVRSP